MRFVIAGASGLLGTALRDRLARDGHDVVRLVRGGPETASESHWDPYAGRLDQAVIDAADVVVCLSGAPLTHWPWTASYKKTFTDSRVRTTRTLAEAVAASPRKPVFLAQNGIAGYGDRGDTVLTEESETGAPTFMGGVTRQWEEATRDGPEAVILNFDDVGYINSTGIAVIVGLLAKARAHGIPLSACGLSDHYREIFEITRLADFMTIADNENGAVDGAERSNHA